MKNILIQFDTDSLPSTFDRVVAIDSGVDQLFSYGGISPENVNGLVHGAIFTRGVKDLKHTAIFVGGSDVAAGEKLAQHIQTVFFGPMRVSVMMDSNGCNTTAAAAVVAAEQHLALSETSALVLGGTGPVGVRVAELLANAGSQVTLVSRSLDRAVQACDRIRANHPEAKLTPTADTDLQKLCQNQQLIVAAGAAGVTFLKAGELTALPDLKVAIDLNAVPPAGLEDIRATDKAVEKQGKVFYGALGVGALKMKVHKQAVASLFEANDIQLNTTEIYQLAKATAADAAR